MKTVRFAVTGDSFMTRRLPGAAAYPDFPAMRSLIESCDFRFNNLEFTAHRLEGAPAAESGGTWAMSEPEILDDLNAYGFNVYNTANNHSLDYGEGGLLATIRHLNERNMPYCGTGEDLDAAAAPVYLTENGVTAAFIGLSASMKSFNPAGPASADMPGRPGLNPLRSTTLYHVDPAHFGALKEIAAATAINAPSDYSRANGYSPAVPEGRFPFGSLNFVLDEKEYKESRPNARDLARTLEGIREAKKKADLVFISIHAHGYDGFSTDEPPRFLETFARAAIDGGADGILGHGPHILRGIEIYKGKPIFYSLGNFIFQTETVRVQPAEAYLSKGMKPEDGVEAYMLRRSNNDTTGYCAIRDIWRSVIACFDMEDRKLKQIRLHPISLGMGTPWEERGWPHLSRDEETLAHLARLSEPYGTAIRIRDGVGYIDEFPESSK